MVEPSICEALASILATANPLLYSNEIDTGGNSDYLDVCTP